MGSMNCQNTGPDLLQGSNMHSLGCEPRAQHHNIVLFIHASDGRLTCHWSVFPLCWAGNLATSRARVTAASRSLPPQLSSGRNKVRAYIVFCTFRCSS